MRTDAIGEANAVAHHRPFDGRMDDAFAEFQLQRTNGLGDEDLFDFADGLDLTFSTTTGV